MLSVLNESSVNALLVHGGLNEDAVTQQHVSQVLKWIPRDGEESLSISWVAQSSPLPKWTGYNSNTAGQHVAAAAMVAWKLAAGMLL